jgi:hypothetical protein
MLEELQREDVMYHVDAAVAELLVAAGVTAPPVDAIAVAQGHLHMQVCLDRRQPQRGRAQRVAGQKQIFLRPEPSEERHQWTVAHEIGEHFKPELLRRLGIEPGQTRAMTGESLANLFADHLLAPSRFFAEDAPLLAYDVLALKAKYKTASHEVIAWRLLDMPAPCIITICDNDRIYRRRSNAWPVRKRLEPPEEKCRRRINRTGQPHVVCENGWTVHGWPVHKPDWKREFLRSVVETDG